MRSICFYFQVHQPLRLRTYRFFDIGYKHNYWDDYKNRNIMRRLAEKNYLPMNAVLLDLFKEYGKKFKVSFSISGITLEQFEMFAPDVLESFQKLAETGNIEFLAETYSHSLAALKSKEEFFRQVKEHSDAIEKYFKQKPVTFRNTELIYSDHVGSLVSELGYKTQIAEGAKHVLGWKSPNFLYCNAANPKLKLLLRNYQLSDDIAIRFSNQAWNQWPLTAEKYVSWLNTIERNQEVVNLFMDYETFGEHHWAESGIFDFFKNLPSKVFKSTNFTFNTPKEIVKQLQPVAPIFVPYPISWADEERDLAAWLGNELQDEAFDKLYEIETKINQCHDEDILKDWKYLQSSDHFYYMCTKWFSDGAMHRYHNPYNSPYEAFINYMNVLSDFIIRVNNSCNQELSLNINQKQSIIKPQKQTQKPKTMKAENYQDELNFDDIISSDELLEIANKPAKPAKKKKQKATVKPAPKSSNGDLPKEMMPKTRRKASVKKAAEVSETSGKKKTKKTKTAAAPKKAAKKVATKKATAPKKAAKKVATKKATAPKKAAKKAAPKKAAAPKKVAKKVAPKKAAAPKKVAKKVAPKKAAAPKKVAKKVAPKKAAAPKKK